MTLGSRHSQQIIGHKFRHDQNTESVDQVLLISQLRARRTEGIHPASCAVLHQREDREGASCDLFKRSIIHPLLVIQASYHSPSTKFRKKI